MACGCTTTPIINTPVIASPPYLPGPAISLPVVETSVCAVYPAMSSCGCNTAPSFPAGTNGFTAAVPCTGKIKFIF